MQLGIMQLVRRPIERDQSVVLPLHMSHSDPSSLRKRKDKSLIFRADVPQPETRCSIPMFGSHHPMVPMNSTLAGTCGAERALILRVIRSAYFAHPVPHPLFQPYPIQRSSYSSRFIASRTITLPRRISIYKSRYRACFSRSRCS